MSRKPDMCTGMPVCPSLPVPSCSTVLMPGWFLPLACTANLAKNLAAVAASSTRAPIYRTFAKHNNLADVTAKGGWVGGRVGGCLGMWLTGTAMHSRAGHLPALPFLAPRNLPDCPAYCPVNCRVLQGRALPTWPMSLAPPLGLPWQRPTCRWCPLLRCCRLATSFPPGGLGLAVPSLLRHSLTLCCLRAVPTCCFHISTRGWAGGLALHVPPLAAPTACAACSACPPLLFHTLGPVCCLGSVVESVLCMLCCRREVDAVVLPYLNRARLSYAARAFCSTGGCCAARSAFCKTAIPR